MRRLLSLVFLSAIGSVALAACTPELPKLARESQLPAGVKSAAIPLERALKEGMLEARPLSTHSTRTEMAILLKPLVTSQPWIRIDPGWVAKNEEFSQVSFVTTHTVYARLPKRKDFRIRVRHVRPQWSKATGMPNDASLEQHTEPRLVDFLRKTGDGDKDPDWKELQIAVWALTDDISYDAVKPPTAGSHHGFRGNHQFATAGQIDGVMVLLASGGHDREEFSLWQTITAELDHQVEAYENYCDGETAAKAFIPFRKICNFYPLDVAADVMFGAFDRHEGEKGRDFRRHAVAILGEHAMTNRGSRKEIELLKRRASFEDDQGILKTMRGIITEHENSAGRVVAAPGK